MFGKVFEVNENKIKMVNNTGSTETSILNYHVVFEEGPRKVVAEIIGVTEKEIEAMLIGEIVNGEFITGVIKKPSFKNPCRIIVKPELETLIGKQDFSGTDTVLLGKSSTYNDFNVTANINDLFSTHFAILGNTGAGKSCTVTRLFQNIFYRNENSMPYNAHLVIFDAFGEYNTAFENLNQIPSLAFKYYTTDVKKATNNLVKIPTYFLEVDDLALLLNATDSQQLPIIEKTLQLVYIFKSQDAQAQQYKSDIIAKSLLDILSSGKQPTQVRDQIIAVLTSYNTPDINLDTIIAQPGYNRTLRQCLNIDNQGKMSAVSLVVDMLSNFAKTDLDKIEVKHDFAYGLEDLYQALEFALLGEGVLSSEKAFDIANTLKVRLHSIINGEHGRYFEGERFITKEQFMVEFFTLPENPQQTCQIINMNFAYVDDRFAKVLTKIYSKIFFNFATNLKVRASFPIHIILEEAHRYVQNDSDLDIIGYNIFDRITKEGRKYGVILGFITQKPSELSKTALSQCSNFIVLRMYFPDDLNIIKSISSNVTNETLERIKTLRPGMAMVFGSAFKIPLICKFDLPNPMPQSTSVNIEDKWFLKNN